MVSHIEREKGPDLDLLNAVYLSSLQVFWLIKPSPNNIWAYEEWIRGGNNSKSFFGRVADKCTRVELLPGDTFFIPSGML